MIKSRLGRGFQCILAVFLGAVVTTELQAQVVVVPNSLTATDGNSSVESQQTPPGDPGTPIRYMQVFDASQFAGLGGPIRITQFAHRPDTLPGPSGPRFPSLQIFVSTTTRSVASLSTTFADNIGLDNTLVFSGTLTSQTANLPGPGNTKQFDIVFPFTTPFLYDPAAGNLLIEVRISSTSGTNALVRDTHSDDPNTKVIGAIGSTNAATGGVGVPFVTQFTYEPPPLATIRLSQVEVCWNSQSNLTYQVQYRSDLTSNLWSSLGNCIRSTGSRSCITDPIVVGQPQRFYRVALTNCVP
ncbi:MAG: hypothetical protein ABIV39_16850 [Verrucomicrobiota bacterium]